VRSEGNGSTTLDTAAAYARARAGELCQLGYGVLDSTSMLIKTEHSLNGMPIGTSERPVAMLLVQCKQPAGGEVELTPDTSAPDDRWWCATGGLGVPASRLFGLCARTKEDCRAQRAKRAGPAYDMCVPRPQAGCYRLATGRSVSLECTPTLAICHEAREDTLFYIQRDADYNRHVLSQCAMTD